MACKWKKNDMLMDKTTKKLFFVVRTKGHKTMLRNEEDDEVEEVANHFANRVYMKVDVDFANTLYGDTEEDKTKGTKDGNV